MQTKNRRRAFGNASSSTTGPTSSIEGTLSDCEIVEQLPETIIVLEDEDIEHSANDSVSTTNQIDEISTSSSNAIQQAVETPNLPLFFEDKAPTSDFVVPIYDIGKSISIQENKRPTKTTKSTNSIETLTNKVATGDNRIIEYSVVQSNKTDKQNTQNTSDSCQYLDESRSEFEPVLSSTRLPSSSINLENSFDNSGDSSKMNFIISVQTSSDKNETIRTVTNSSNNSILTEKQTDSINENSMPAEFIAIDTSASKKRKAERELRSEQDAKRLKDIIVINDTVSDTEYQSDGDENSVVFVSETMNRPSKSNVISFRTASDPKSLQICLNNKPKVRLQINL